MISAQLTLDLALVDFIIAYDQFVLYIHFI